MYETIVKEVGGAKSCGADSSSFPISIFLCHLGLHQDFSRALENISPFDNLSLTFLALKSDLRMTKSLCNVQILLD